MGILYISIFDRTAGIFGVAFSNTKKKIILSSWLSTTFGMIRARGST
jgi:hypothetical protein